jgi:transposase-like protein
MPIASPDPNDLPLIGQSVRVVGYTILPLVACGCSDSDSLQLIAQVADGKFSATTATCPQCQSTYRVVTIETDARGLLVFGLDKQSPIRP